MQVTNLGGFYFQRIAERLSGPRARLERAERNLAELAAALDEIHQRLHDAIRFTWKPNGDLDLRIVSTPTSQPDDLPLEVPVLIGEIAYNLRSALDSLVYDLAVYGGQRVGRDTVADPITQSQFPIEDSESVFEARITGKLGKRSMKRYLECVEAEHVEAIRAAQPFGRKDFWTAVLRDISNQDKHRHLADLAFDAEIQIPTPIERGASEIEVHTGAVVYVQPQGWPALETLQLLKRETEVFIDRFYVELQARGHLDPTAPL